MIKKIALLALAAVMMTACASSLSGEFTRLADKVAENGADYTPQQWENANDQFEDLLQEYKDNYDKIPDDEKKVINDAIGRYLTTALRCGVEDGWEQIDDFLEELPDVFSSTLEGAKGFLEGIAF